MPDFHVAFRNLLHAVYLRHGTDGFTSPSEGRRAEDFFALKNPTASAGFEPANLGTKGQHATSRPPKPQVSPLHSSSGEVKNLSTSVPSTFLHGVDMQNLTLNFNSNSSQSTALPLLSHCSPTQSQSQLRLLSYRGTNFSIPCQQKRPNHKWSHLTIIPFGTGIKFSLQPAVLRT